MLLKAQLVWAFLCPSFCVRHCVQVFSPQCNSPLLAADTTIRLRGQHPEHHLESKKKATSRWLFC
jgi:hypothetical protein